MASGPQRRTTPQGGGDDDGVVGVPDHWDEVGHQVDRRGEVAEQQPQPDPRAAG
jgi:hypothetical protein